MKTFTLFSIALLAFVTAQEEGGTPVVMWHGMGDSCCSFGMNRLKKVIEDNTPAGTYVTSLKIGDNIIDESLNGFLLHTNIQVEMACNIIVNDTKLANGYHSVGLSQGAQFLRAVAQRCPNPPMKNLVSMGGQHQGVYGFPGCPGEDFFMCDFMRHLLNLGAYLDVVQSTLVQAQYWHDPLDYETYVEKSQFIAEINNERGTDNEYGANLANLEHFVMVKFDEDSMVHPMESQHFEFYFPGNEDNVQPLRESLIYTDDRIGLKQLDEAGKLVFLNIPGADHLQFSDEWFIENIITPYFN